MDEKDNVDVNVGGSGDSGGSGTSVDFNALVTKFTELTDMINALTAKVTQQGVLQEGLTSKTLVQEEKDYDIGTSEAWQANLKQMFDSFLYENLESMRRDRLHFDRMMTHALDADKFKEQQAIRHADIAMYKLWGLSPPTEYKDDGSS